MHGSRGQALSLTLLRRLLNSTVVDFLAIKGKTQEDRRILWTTYDNIKMWFDNWSRTLVEEGFAETRDGKDPYIPLEQLRRIINLDETCLSLDGSSGNRGGRPEVVFYDPNLPRLGKATGKTAKTTTMITGSNAAGEALPPHFQFQTAAKSAERERLRMELVKWLPQTRGTFGASEERLWPCTVGMNGV